MKKEEASGSHHEERTICSLLEEKLTLCKKIVESTQILKDALGSQDIDHLVRAIAQRQTFMDAVDNIDGTIMKFKAHGRKEFRGETMTRVKYLMSAIEGAMQTAIPLNHDCEKTTEQILDFHRGELQRIQRTRKAYHGYARGMPASARFCDVST